MKFPPVLPVYTICTLSIQQKLSFPSGLPPKLYSNILVVLYSEVSSYNTSIHLFMYITNILRTVLENICIFMMDVIKLFGKTTH